MTKKDINGKEYLFVGLPEDARSPWIEDGSIQYNLVGISADFGSQRLPEGRYTIIGKGDTLSEEQWEMIVESFDDSDSDARIKKTRWINYEMRNPYHDGYVSAIESGLSLIKSIGMKPENCLVIIKNNLL